MHAHTLFTHTHTHSHTFPYIQLHAYTYIDAYICMHTHRYTYITTRAKHIHTRTCAHARVHTHTHTHMLIVKVVSCIYTWLWYYQRDIYNYMTVLISKRPSTWILLVSEVLERAAQIHPGLMLQEVEVVKHKHRQPQYCDRLAQYTQGLLSTGASWSKDCQTSERSDICCLLCGKWWAGPLSR